MYKEKHKQKIITNIPNKTQIIANKFTEKQNNKQKQTHITANKHTKHTKT